MKIAERAKRKWDLYVARIFEFAIDKAGGQRSSAREIWNSCTAHIFDFAFNEAGDQRPAAPTPLRKLCPSLCDAADYCTQWRDGMFKGQCHNT